MPVAWESRAGLLKSASIIPVTLSLQGSPTFGKVSVSTNPVKNKEPNTDGVLGTLIKPFGSNIFLFTPSVKIIVQIYRQGEQI